MSTFGEYTLEEINHTLLQFESEFNLFERQADGVYYWGRVRHPVHKKVISNIESSGENSLKTNRYKGYYQLKKELTAVIDGFKNLFFKNPYFSNDCEIVFYGKGRRRQRDDGTWYDLHLDPIAEMVDASYTFLEPTYGPAQAASENRRYLSLPLSIADIARKLGYAYNLTKREKTVLQQVESAIATKLSVTVDLVSHVERELSNRRLLLPHYMRIINQINPEICFMTYGHSHHTTFVEACNAHDVPVVDVQYCALNQNYWPYHYPGNRSPAITADYLFLWGEYWRETVTLPFSTDNIFVVGYPYYERQVKKLENKPKKEQILFLSNPKSGPVLSKIASDLAEHNLSTNIVYKLHGAEFDTWKQDYPQLMAAEEANQLTVIDDAEGSLYRLLAESVAQVGVSTTALYEGIGFGLPTFIVEAPAAAEMSELIKQGYAKRVSNSIELADYLNQIDDANKPDAADFFATNATERTEDAIADLKDRLNIGDSMKSCS